jgi:hypothetical protein
MKKLIRAICGLFRKNQHGWSTFGLLTNPQNLCFGLVGTLAFLCGLYVTGGCVAFFSGGSVVIGKSDPHFATLWHMIPLAIFAIAMMSFGAALVIAAIAGTVCDVCRGF